MDVAAEQATPPDPKADEELMTASEVAAIFRVSRQAVNSWAKRGVLPAIQVMPHAPTRFRRVDVEKLLAPKQAS